MESIVAVLFCVVIVFAILTYIQLDEYRKRIRFLEVRVEALIKQSGIPFDDSDLLPVQVRQALEAGQKLKAIRLYRQITGAGLKEASEVIEELSRR